MSLASRVPSRSKRLKGFLMEESVRKSESVTDCSKNQENYNTKRNGESSSYKNPLKLLKVFRTNVIKKCSHKLSKSWPRVRLIQDSEVRDISPPKPYPINEGLHYILGWMMSFVGVALLTSSSNNINGDSITSQNTVFLDIESDEEDQADFTQLDMKRRELDDENGCLSGSPSPLSCAMDDLEIPKTNEVDAVKMEAMETEYEPKLEDDNWTSRKMHDDLEVSELRPTQLETEGRECDEKVDKQAGVDSPSISSAPDHSNASNHAEFSSPQLEPIFSEGEQCKEDAANDFSNDTNLQLNINSPDEEQVPVELGQMEDELPSTSTSSTQYKFRTRRKRSEESDLEDPEVDDDFQPTFSNASSSDTDDNSNDEEDYKMHSNPKLRKTRSDKGQRRGQKKLYCQLDGCNRVAHSKEDFDDHQKYHEKGEFKCNFCEQVEENAIRLSIHEHSKHSTPPQKDSSIKTKDSFLCPRCPFQTGQFWRYKNHFAESHIPGFRKRLHMKVSRPKSENTTAPFGILAFRCLESLCTEKFRTKDDLERHQYLHGSFQCNFCSVVKDYAPKIAIHESEDHTIRSEEETEKTRKWKQLSCSRCSSNFRFKGLYIHHFLSAHLNLPGGGQSCPICKVEIMRRYSMMQHFELYHKTEGLEPSQIFKCDLCPAYFIQGNQLYIHKVRFHFKGKCPKCGRNMKGFRSLRKHLETRHPEFQAFTSFVFTCDIANCREKFATQGMLNRHKRRFRHAGDAIATTVKCKQCGKEFQDERKLKSHMYQFHSEMKFICSECGKSFKVKSRLKRHQMYHRGPDAWKFQCSTCGRKFVNKQKLEEHTRTHTKEKPYICQYCGEKYAHRHNWRNHVKTKHAQEYKESDEILDSSRKKGGEMLSRKGSKKGECILAGVLQK